MEVAEDGDVRVIATARKILDSFGTSENVKDDMILILSNFDNRFSAITELLSAGGASIEKRLAAAEEVVLGWGRSDSKGSRRCWEDSPDVSVPYLSAVDEILNLAEDLSPFPAGESSDLAGRAEIALQLAMSKLEDVFRDILTRNNVPLDAGLSCGSVPRSFHSFASNDFESEEDAEGSVNDELACCDDDEGRASLRDLAVDLVDPDAVEDLRDIAERMMRSGYEQECCGIYSRVRRDALDKCLSVLGVEKVSIEEVQKMGWRSLDAKMKRWIRAVKAVTRVLLPAERRLCKLIFAGSELVMEVCFGENARNCVMQLMIFADAIVVGRRSSEKLFRIIDMYDALADALPDLRALLSGDDCGRFVVEDVQRVVSGLGGAAKGALAEFERAVRSEASRKPVQRGEIHPLSRYVMNYAKLLADYSNVLNLLLEDDSSNGSNGPDENDEEDDGGLHSGDGSPLSRHLRSTISYLESSLEAKSRSYEDAGLQYVFLMNNALYIVQKVKGSVLCKFLGTQWVRRHQGQIRRYSTAYLRASWSRVLSCLTEDGKWCGGRPSSACGTVVKERFRSFNACFEDAYRTQTGWRVADPQLRDELRISISEKVLPAYRSFLGRSRNQLERGRHPGRYVKYTLTDLEKYISELFEGNCHRLKKKQAE